MKPDRALQTRLLASRGRAPQAAAAPTPAAAHEQAVRSLDERIADALRAAHASGELQRSAAWGKPLPDDGFLDTPPELRIAFKVLKNAGHVPPEVALMQELQRWRDALTALDAGGEAARELRQRIVDRELLIALHIERLARTLTL